MNILLKLVGKDAATIDNMKQINTALLSFREGIGKEIMRILILPENDMKTTATSKIHDSCQKYERVIDSVSTIVNCAQSKHLTQENGEENKQKCFDPTIYWTELIEMNENIDFEIKTLYTAININHNL